MKQGTLLLWAITVMLFLSSCEKEFARYYEYDGSTETIFDILKDKKEYALFAEALELVGYSDILSSAGLFTVLAVDDTAFRTYLESKGYNQVKDVPREELKKLIGYHILEWPYIVSKLHSGWSSSTTPEDPLMIRKLTRCLPDVYTESDPTTGMPRLVASERKLIPFISKSYLEGMGISANDVLTFHPELNADFDAGDVIASKALFVERDILASNGWLHTVDRVLIPLRNQKDVIEQEDNYSLFRTLSKSFATFSYDAGATSSYMIDNDGNGDNDSVFAMNYFDLNKEYVGTTGTISGNADKINVQRNFISAFVPTNEALKAFFAQYYPGVSIDDDTPISRINIAKPALRSIVSSCIFKGKAWYPSAIASGQLETRFGIPYIYDESSFQSKEVVSNGLFYGVNNFRAPDEYNSLAKTFMTDSTYSHFLVSLDNSRYLNLLVSSSVDFTVFAVKNQTFRDAGYFLDETQTKFVDEEGNAISFSDLDRKIRNHIILGELDVKSFSSDMYYKTIAPRETYLKISSSEASANGVEVANLLDDGINEGNGVIYEVDNFLSSPESTQTIGYVLKNTANLRTFYDLLKQVGIIDSGDGNTVLFNEGNMTCFAPTNDALANVTLPSDNEELKQFLAKFFVKKTIFSDGQRQGTYDTFAKDLVNSTPAQTVNIQVEISASSGVITVVNKSSGESAVTKTGIESDKMLYNGCLHTIESVY